MIVEHILSSTLFLITMFFLYQYFLFSFIDTIFLQTQKKKHWLWISFCNTGLLLYTIFYDRSLAIGVYLALLCLFFTECCFIYQGMYKKICCLSLVVMLHVMAVRAISVALFSWQTGLSIYDVVNDLFLHLLSTGVTFLLLNLIFFLIGKILSCEKMRIINQYEEQFSSIIICLLVFNLYLWQNARIYNQQLTYFFFNENQIIAPLAILLGLYMIIFFMIKTNDLLTYKEKNWQMQQEVDREQQLRNSLVSDVLLVYEFNLTKNEIIGEFEGHKELLADGDRRYSHMIELIGAKFIHPEDVQLFYKYANIHTLLSAFKEGKREIVGEYRSRFLEGEYIWGRKVINLRKDEDTGDIKGFTYIKNIDREKKMHLALQMKAERDSLTGLYNKGMTGKLIADYLALSMENKESSALYIIDIDNFKSINDYFGHVYGDVVLCELSEKLQKIFPENAIIGRIGGDEFVAFMKKAPSKAFIQAKGVEICKEFTNVYQGEGQTEHRISGSIGIAIFPDHGSTFEDLYRHADIALYASKNKGKNTYTIYNGEAFTAYKSNRTEIDQSDLFIQKNFKSNRVEYVFKILYESPNPVSAVHSVLKLLTGHFNFSRGYIFETSENEEITSNTFEWCAENIEPQIDMLKNVPLKIITRANQSFQATGMNIMCSLSNIPPEEYAVLEPQGIKSMMQFAMFQSNQLMGFIGFDDCLKERVPTKDEIAELSMLCNILATFLMKQRAIEKAENNAATMSAILNNLNSFTYVIDKDTYEILFLNKKTKEVTPYAEKGDICYRSFRGNTAVCEDCPLQALTTDSTTRSTQVMYNQKYNLWIETTATYIHWIDGKMACLINCVDITKFKCSDWSGEKH